MEDRSPAPQARAVVASGPLAAPVAVVGAGTAARALLRALRDADVPLAGICARHAGRGSGLASAHGVPWLGAPEAPAPGLVAAPVVILAVSDGAIAEVAATLARSGGPWAGRVALHVSGSLPADAARALSAAGAAVASWHPLATLAVVPAAGWTPGTPFFAEGDDAALAVARQLTAALGGRWRELPPGTKPAYHAAATLAGNLVHVLFDAAAAILASRGVDAPAESLAPLARASLEAAVGAPGLGLLTGPVARADAGTLAANVEALAAEPAELRAAHAALSLLANELLRSRGRGEPAARDAVARVLHEELRHAVAALQPQPEAPEAS